MTLTTHAIAGAAIASLMPEHLVLAPIAAFASHFILDAIPHYDYPIRSAGIDPSVGGKLKLDSNFLKDLFSIGGDALLGVVLGVLLFATPATFWLVFACAAFGILPDALQFVYAKFPKSLLAYLQRFHMGIHTKHFMKSRIALGWVTQIGFVAVLVILAKYMKALML